MKGLLPPSLEEIIIILCYKSYKKSQFIYTYLRILLTKNVEYYKQTHQYAVQRQTLESSLKIQILHLCPW